MRPRSLAWAAVAALVAAAGVALWILAGPDGGASDGGPARRGPLSERVELDHPGPGSTVVPPVVVAGSAPGGWYFEATFPLRLTSPDGRSIADSFATARGDWMTGEQVPYRGVLRPAAGAAAGGGDAILLLERANASGLPEHDAEVRSPLRLAGPDVPRVFFGNAVLDPAASDCASVWPVVRELDGSGGAAEGDGGAGPGAVGRARRLLDALLAGPTADERAAGYHTSLPDSVGVRSLALRGDTLTVDFDRRMEEGVGGSCRVVAIRAQLERTLGRLPGVRRVAIRVEGSVAEALQP